MACRGFSPVIEMAQHVEGHYVQAFRRSTYLTSNRKSAIERRGYEQVRKTEVPVTVRMCQKDRN